MRGANALNKRIPHWQRKSGNSSPPATDRIAPMVRALESREIRLEALEQMLDSLLKPDAISTEEVLVRYRRSAGDLAALDERLKEVAAKASAMPGRSLETLERWGMGALMRHFLGKLNPKVVSERLTEVLTEVLSNIVAGGRP